MAYNSIHTYEVVTSQRNIRPLCFYCGIYYFLGFGMIALCNFLKRGQHDATVIYASQWGKELLPLMDDEVIRHSHDEARSLSSKDRWRAGRNDGAD